VSLVSTLLAIVLPVFLVVASGYATVRLKAFPDEGVNYLMRFTTGLAVPCLLFKGMYDLELGASMRLDHLVSFYAAALACFAGVGLISRYLLRRRPGEAVSVGFSAMFGNSVLLGIPIMQRAYDEAALNAMFALIAFHAPIFYAVGIFAMEMLKKGGAGALGALVRTAKAIIGNPLLIGLALGLACNLGGLPLPDALYEAVAMMGRAALPVALFGLGGVLTRYALRSEIGEALLISVFALVVRPGLAWLLSAHLFGLPEPFVRAAVLMAAMPPGVNGYVFAAMYDRAVGTAASAVILGTVLSLATITFWLALLGSAGI